MKPLLFAVKLILSYGCLLSFNQQADGQGGPGNAFSNTFVGCWGVSDGSVAWDDYDRNGQLDLLVTGGDGTNVHTCLFRNEEGTLTYVPDRFSSWGFGSAGLPVVQRGFAGWGDFDNDGAVDVLLTGYTANW